MSTDVLKHGDAAAAMHACDANAVQTASLTSEAAPKKGSMQRWENGVQTCRLAMGRADGKLSSDFVCLHLTPSSDDAAQAAPLSTETALKKGSIQKWENGFQIERLAMGKPDGKLAKPGKKVVVKYRGSLANGKVFDETKGNKTFSFRLGEAAGYLQDKLVPLHRLQAMTCLSMAVTFACRHNLH